MEEGGAHGRLESGCAGLAKDGPRSLTFVIVGEQRELTQACDLKYYLHRDEHKMYVRYL